MAIRCAKAFPQPIVEGEADIQFFTDNCDPRMTGMCVEIHKHRGLLWTFVDHEGVELTNNTAQRALLPTVISRKLSFRTRRGGLVSGGFQ